MILNSIRTSKYLITRKAHQYYSKDCFFWSKTAQANPITTNISKTQSNQSIWPNPSKPQPPLPHHSNWDKTRIASVAMQPRRLLREINFGQDETLDIYFGDPRALKWILLMVSAGFYSSVFLRMSNYFYLWIINIKSSPSEMLRPLKTSVLHPPKWRCTHDYRFPHHRIHVTGVFAKPFGWFLVVSM